MRRAEEFFAVSVTRSIDPDTCLSYTDSDETTFATWAAIASAFVWLCIFLAVFRGVKSSSWIIWLTVPLPCLFILFMLFHGISLEGAKKGINDYIKGRDDPSIVMGEMWADAIG
jgi:fatty acid desaturase